MIGDKQTQKAGDNSQLVQASQVNIYNGIGEDRVREICAETYAIARRDFTADAYACANQRVEQFESVLLPRMQQIEGAFSKFADPSFQILLTNAQRAAAATERNADYAMLAELLVCRITKGESRKKRAGISKAIEIVDMVDDDALCALTVAHAINTLAPATGDLNSGLKVLDTMFNKLMYTKLPEGDAWIEHLNILDAVRINPVSHFNKLEVFYPQALDGYSAAGIRIESEEYRKAIEILSEVNLDKSILVPNELMEGYVKINVTNKKSINNIELAQIDTTDGKMTVVPIAVNEKMIMALHNVWDLYEKDNEIVNKARSTFMTRWDSYPALNTLHQWWNKLSTAFVITPVGTALAHTNARRCDNTIPELPLET